RGAVFVPPGTPPPGGSPGPLSASTVTFSCLGCEGSPRASVTVSVTVYCPALVYVWRGLASLLREPSPKSQCAAIRSPSGSVDRFTKWTVSGAAPLVGLATKSARGAWLPGVGPPPAPAVTLMVVAFGPDDRPWASVTSSLTVNFPAES